MWSKKTERLVESPINWLIEYALKNPSTISLAAGLVEEESLPSKELEHAFLEILRLPEHKKFLQYGTTSGLDDLKISTLNWLKSLEPKDLSFDQVGVEELIITNGCQQLLYLLSEVLLDDGDIVIVESPSYFVYTDSLKSNGVEFIGIPMTKDGMDVSVLRKVLEELENKGKLARLKMIYSIPWCQNPTGISRSPENFENLKDVLIEYSQRSDFYFVEDAAYRGLVFEKSVISPSLLSVENLKNRIVYGTTFSKPFAPGLKLGAGIVPSPLREKVLLIKGNHDFGSSHWNQALMWKLIENGGLEVARNRVLKSYESKANLLYNLLKKALPVDFELEKTSGGMYLWLICPMNIETGKSSNLFQNCLKNGVIYVPGEYCDIDESRSKNSIRFSFGRVSSEDIEIGVQRFLKALSLSS